MCFQSGFIVHNSSPSGCSSLQSAANRQTAPAKLLGRIAEMSIAVPVIIVVLLSAQVYNVWPNYHPEQDKSEQADESSSEKDKSEKDKSEKADRTSSTTASKDKRHSHMKRKE